MTFKNASSFPELYESMGYKTWGLGCFMLETEAPYEAVRYHPEDEHISTDPRKKYVKGVLDENHVTVRYGLLPGVEEHHVLSVIDGVGMPTELTVDHYECFPSTDPDEPFDCVVARVKDPRLDALNEQLSILPNINTFVEYKPHITIGYFRPGWFKDNEEDLAFQAGLSVGVIGYSYSPARD